MMASPSDCLGRSPNAPSDCNFTEHPAVAASNDAFKGAAADTGAGYIDQSPWFCTTACPSITTRSTSRRLPMGRNFALA